MYKIGKKYLFIFVQIVYWQIVEGVVQWKIRRATPVSAPTKLGYDVKSPALLYAEARSAGKSIQILISTFGVGNPATSIS